MDQRIAWIAVVILIVGAAGLWGCKRATQRATPTTEEVTPELRKKIMAAVEKLAVPSYALKTRKANPGKDRSFIGGKPLAPASLEWPQWKGTSQSFLGQIALKDLPPVKDSPLPDKGILYFFYDAQQGAWGFDPKDRDSFRVVYLPDAGSAKLVQHDFPSKLPKVGRYRQMAFSFSVESCLPDPEGLEIIAPDLPKEIGEGYYDLAIDEDLGPAMQHRLLGYPTVIQNDMRLECALVTNGLYCGDASGYKDPRAKELRKQAKDWILLFQVITDDDTEMMWGDSGNIYFWIRKDDLAKADFTKCWVILQCY